MDNNDLKKLFASMAILAYGSKTKDKMKEIEEMINNAFNELEKKNGRKETKTS